MILWPPHHLLDLTQLFSFRSFLVWDTVWHPEKVGKYLFDRGLDL